MSLRWLGPIIAQCIIVYTYFCAIINMLLWMYPSRNGERSIYGKLHIILYSIMVLFIQINFFTSMIRGPGFVPKNWKPDDKRCEQFLQYCNRCNAFKAPRSHHCRRLNRCVLKMEHYCPWIGTCVGHYNHAHFQRFLMIVEIGCPWSIFIIFKTSYDQIYTPWQDIYAKYPSNYVFFTSTALMYNIIGFACALGTFLAVGFLCYQQTRIILKNETSIESWIVEKSYDRIRSDEEPPFVYPYNLGKWQNWKSVMGWHCCKSKLSCNGLEDWPVIPDSGQYTLTIEQLNQKAFKKAMTRYGTVVKKFSGWWFPCFSYGCCVGCVKVPKTDESRLSVKIDEKMSITRAWGDHWWYGEVIDNIDTKDIKRIPKRGWFPRKCIKLTDGGPDPDDIETAKEK